MAKPPKGVVPPSLTGLVLLGAALVPAALRASKPFARRMAVGLVKAGEALRDALDQDDAEAAAPVESVSVTEPAAKVKEAVIVPEATQAPEAPVPAKPKKLKATKPTKSAKLAKEEKPKAPKVKKSKVTAPEANAGDAPDVTSSEPPAAEPVVATTAAPRARARLGADVDTA